VSDRKPENPGAGIMERFRKSNVALRWGVLAILAMVLFILLTA